MTTQEHDLRQEWETPQDFFDVVDAEFGFDIDVCATSANTKCSHFIGLQGNALDICVRWYDPYEGGGTAWCNPGFTNIGPWMEKAYAEVIGGDTTVVVVMALVSPSTKWWRDWAMKASEIRLLGGKRVQFVAPEGVKQSSNARENCLIIFRPNPHNRKPDIWTWDWTE